MYHSHSEKAMRQPLIPTEATPESTNTPRQRAPKWMMLLLIATNLLLLITFAILATAESSSLSTEKLEKNAWEILKDYAGILDVPPITRQEFLQRQSRLAAALAEAGVDAFIAEPSASSSYYANISVSYELSERPFLMILDSSGQFSYLAPKFELGRIAGLHMVFDEKKIIEWREEESPYEVLRREMNYKKVMLDEHVRFMIAAGIQATGVEVVPMSETIQSLRSVKTNAELAILRAINGFTLQLVRSLQKSIRIGMTQETIFEAASALFTRAGVGKGCWAIVLFGEQAASPHSGSSGKTLKDGEFILIDIGSKLHGYGSDVTRTILPAKSKVSKELMDVWKTVHAAQSAAVAHMTVNQMCSVVDAASRNVIAQVGYEAYYTHRLGHGLGLEMHEHPYLNGANSDKLRVNEVVTNEPGIYVTADQAKKMNKDVGFGVRLEDPILVTEYGGVPMTGSRARSPYEP